jgi:hypothetical protein
MDIADAVLAQEQRRCAAMLGNDLQALDVLLDQQLYFCHATGAVDDKVAYLSKISQGRIIYRSIEWSDRVTAVDGDVVIVTGRMTSAVSVDGVDKCLDNRVLALWLKKEGQWRLRAFQTTPLKK